MARSTYGATSVDWLLRPYPFGSTTLVALRTGTTFLTFWDQPTGGTRYMDLLDAFGTPITQVTVVGHQIPSFQGPDAVLAMWADKGDGSPRERIEAQDLAAAAAAVAAAEAARDAAIAAAANTVKVTAQVLTEPQRAQARTNLGDPAYSVAGWGASPSGTFDSAQAIQAAINAVEEGAVLRVPAGDHLVGAELVISKPMTLTGPGRLVSVHGGSVVKIVASGVTLRGLRILGRQRASYVATERGVNVAGASAGLPVRGLVIEGCSISNNGGGGIVAQYCEDFSIRDNYITENAYFGISMISGKNGAVFGNTVNDVSTSGMPNAYGITATKLNGTQADQPRPSDIAIEGNYVANIPAWAGIDTHGGVRIRARKNVVYATKRGIDFVAGEDVTNGVQVYAPEDCEIIDNVVDGGGVATSHGIGMSGASTGPGAVAAYATGVVRGNHVIRAGDSTSSSLGAYWFRATKDLVIEGNRATEPGSHGIAFTYENIGFQVIGFTAVDPWSDSHVIPSVVATRSTNCSGVISGLYGRRGTKVATTVLAYGVYQSDPASTTTIAVGPDCQVDSGTLLAEASSGLRTFTRLQASMLTVGRGNGRVGFYGATPSAKLSVTGSRGGNAALASLLTALASYGLITDSTTT